MNRSTRSLPQSMHSSGYEQLGEAALDRRLSGRDGGGGATPTRRYSPDARHRNYITMMKLLVVERSRRAGPTIKAIHFEPLTP